MSFYVKFWGTRGSIPTPASWTRVYGGNTSCVEIRTDDSLFVCDCGSGIRELGKDLMTRGKTPDEIHLFITHTHWDHIQGFPFFAPAYIKKNRIKIYAPSASENNPYDLLSGQMSQAYFPVSFKDLGAQVVRETIADSCRMIEGVKVCSIKMNHPGGCYGYSFEKDGVKIVYATDNELEIAEGDKFPDLDHTGPLRKVPDELLEAIKGADLLITDAQYDDAEYALKKGWGHSSCYSVVDLAIQAGAKNLALFHHDPESADRQIDIKVEDCRQRCQLLKGNVIIFAAREGIELKF